MLERTWAELASTTAVRAWSVRKGLWPFVPEPCSKSQKGSIGGNTGVTLVTGLVDNGRKDGSAPEGTLDANLKGCFSRGKSLVGERGVTLDLNGGTWTRPRSGFNAWRAPAAPTGMVDNSVGGEISSDRAFTLAANTLNKQGGRLISSEALTLRTRQDTGQRSQGAGLATGGLACIESQVLDSRAGTVGLGRAMPVSSVTSLDSGAPNKAAW